MTVQPGPALPMTRNMPFVSNSMPSRLPRSCTPKNMTGIYLGSEETGSRKSSQYKIPPLARGRGVPMRARTPTEERRYRHLLMRNRISALVYFYQAIPHLPSLPKPRYPLVSPQKMVEQLRVKEEKRGFKGAAMKNKKTDKPGLKSTSPTHFTQEDEDVLNLVRKTPRHFTTSTNDGISHLEYLNANNTDQSMTSYKSETKATPLSDTIAGEVQRVSTGRNEVTGLEECYKKVCHGNIEALHSLLPQRKYYEMSKNRAQNYTGFSVKSYRNPHQAEIMASFPDDVRPKTTAVGRRPHVPNSYFFKTYNPPQTAHSYPTSCPSQVGRPRKEPFESAYTTTRLISPHHSNKLFPPRDRTPPTSEDLLKESATPAPTPRATGDQANRNNNAISPNAELRHVTSPILIDQSENSDPDQDPDRQNLDFLVDNMSDKSSANHSKKDSNLLNDPKVLTEKTNRLENMESTKNERNNNAGKKGTLFRKDSTPVIGLENESGEKDVVEIDETDEVIANDGEPSADTFRRKSITERLMSAKESEFVVSSVMAEAETRKHELAELIEE
ncbi:unnamed protein product, partial [Owenia fusiformis]